MLSVHGLNLALRLLNPRSLIRTKYFYDVGSSALAYTHILHNRNMGLRHNKKKKVRTEIVVRAIRKV